MMPPLQIALVADGLDGGRGGSGSAGALAQGLVARGHRVTAVVRGRPQSETPLAPGLEIRVLPVPGSGAGAALAFATRSAQLARSLGCDLVHAHTRCADADVWRIGGLPHARWMQDRPLAGLRPAGRRMVSAERRWVRRASALVAVSEVARDEASAAWGVPRAEILVVSNGVDSGHFHPRYRREMRAAARRRFSLPADAPVICAVGHNFRFKGIDTLLDALAQLDGVFALVVGRDGGVWRYRLRARWRRVAHRVRLPGAVQDVREVLAAADVLCHAAQLDPCPNVVLEGAAMGMAVVASAGVGSAELLGPHTRTMPRGGVTASNLADALRPVLADADLRREQGRVNRAAAERLSHDSALERWEAIYRRAAESRLHRGLQATAWI